MAIPKLSRLTLAILIFFVSLPIFAQSNYEQAVERITKNEMREALNITNRALDENENDVNFLYLKLILTDYFGYKNEFYETIIKLSESNAPTDSYLLSSVKFDYTGWREYTNENCLELMKNYYDKPNLNPTVRAYVLDYLATKYRRMNKVSKSKDMIKELGTITKWQFLGSFENISESGFDKDFGALAHPENNYKFVNKNNADIKWFKPVIAENSAWINFDNNFVVNNSIMYAQTFINVLNDTECQLRIGVSGSLKAWVNDQLAFQESDEKNNGVDSYVSKVILRKGWNRVLIQIGCSEIRDANFSLRFVDNKGVVVPITEVSAEQKPYNKEVSYKFETVTNEFFAGLIQKAEAMNASFIDKVIAANILNFLDMKSESRKIIIELQKSYPKSILVSKLLIELYGRDKNRTMASETIQKMMKDDPHCSFAIIDKYNEAVKNKQYDNAEELMNKLKDSYFDLEAIIMMQIQLAGLQDQREKFSNLINVAYTKYPNNLFVGTIFYQYFMNQNFYEKATAILERRLDDDYSLSNLIDLASHLKKIGKNSASVSVLENIESAYPESIYSHFNNGSYLFDFKNYEEAIPFFEKCVEYVPDYAGYYHELGNCYKELNQISKAKEQYLLCLKYNPFHYVVREKLRKLENKEDAFKNFTEPDLYKIYEDNKSKSFEKTDEAVVLTEDKQVVVYKGGAYVEKTYLLIKILSNNGIDMFKEYNVGSAAYQSVEIEKAEVLKKNDNRIKGEIDDESVVFPKLEVGDAILLVYKTRSFKFGNLSNYFSTVEAFNGGFDMLSQKYSLLLMDPTDKLEFKWSNKDYTPNIKQIDNMKLYSWEFPERKKMKGESLMPNYFDLFDVMNISSIPDWNVVSKWYYDIANSKAKIKNEVIEAYKEIFPKGLPQSKLDAAKAIHEYIVKNIRYSYVPFRQSGIIPQRASDVITTRIGDCKDVSTLFVALCREAGIEANWALVATNDDGRNNLLLPSISFNHCIAVAKIDGKKYYVELTSDNVPFGQITYSLDKAMALEILPEGASLIELKESLSPTKSAVKRKIDVSFKDNSMDVVINTSKYGNKAVTMRSSYKDLSEDDKRKEMQTSVNSEYPNLKLIDFNFISGLNQLSDTIQYKYSYRVQNPFSSISNLNVLTLPITDKIENIDFVSLDTRNYPIDLNRWYYDSEFINELNVQIPQDMQLSSKPENVEINNKYFNYSLVYAIEGNNLKVKRFFEVNQDAVSPEEYLEFKNLINKVLKSDTEKIAFTNKPIGSAPLEDKKTKKK